jgi:hypothetical protein
MWINSIKASGGPLPLCILAANKVDLPHDVPTMKQHIFKPFDATFQGHIFFCSAPIEENCSDLLSCVTQTAAASFDQAPGKLTETGRKPCC